RRQRYLARLATLADDVQPPIVMRIALDPSKGRPDQLARTQPRAVAEVQQEAHALRCGGLPPIRPLQPVGERAHEAPLAFSEGPLRVQRRRPRPAHLDA